MTEDEAREWVKSCHGGDAMGWDIDALVTLVLWAYARGRDEGQQEES
jgi:hypothetical protein